MKERKSLYILFGTYSAILLFAAIIGISIIAPKHSADVGEPEVIIETEMVLVWADSSEATLATSERTRIWTVREYEGVIGVFDEEGRLVHSLDVYVKTLPEADRRLLRKGITVRSEKQLRDLLEDYSS